MSNSEFPISRRSFVAGAAASASLVALHPFAVHAKENQAHLRLMETTDLHVHVYPYDYYSDKEIDTVGLSRTATIINEIRAEATNSMLSTMVISCRATRWATTSPMSAA